MLTVSAAFSHYELDKIQQFICAFYEKIESSFPQMFVTPSVFSDLYLKCCKLNSSLFSIILDNNRKQVLGSQCLQDQKGSIKTPCFTISSFG